MGGRGEFCARILFDSRAGELGRWADEAPLTYRLTNRWGRSRPHATVDEMREALAELDVGDVEHPDASLTHESEWCLGAFGNGLLVWENLEDGNPRHMKGVARDKVLQLWQALSRGDLVAIEREAWRPGYD